MPDEQTTAVSLAEVKAHLNITVDTHDTELQSMLEAAEATIGQLVGPLAPTEVTTYVPYPGATALSLPVLPVLSLTSVTAAGTDTTIDVSTLHVNGPAGLVSSLAGGYPWSAVRGYNVVYTAGRVPVPADLLLAVKELVRHFWQTQRGTTGRSRNMNETLANTIPGAAYALPIRVTQLLTPHMQFGFA